MTGARYDEVADFYAAGWSGVADDPASVALLGLLGDVRGKRILDAACGHGRISRELARRGADVTGVDISAALIGRAVAAEEAEPLGICYVHADLSSSDWLAGRGAFDAAACNFGLSDVDDLDGALTAVAAALVPRGRFVLSVLHPCFPGGRDVSGSWPGDGSYHDEGRWTPDGAASGLRRLVGANHRTLSTYVAALRRHGLRIDEVVEPRPEPVWSARHPDAARHPLFLVVACVRGRG